MKRIKYLLTGIALTGLFNACKPDLEAPSVSSGESAPDFSKYVAFGDYHTAGYMNGGVSRESQQNAYPNILARQFALIGGPAEFRQPYFSAPTPALVELQRIENGFPVITGGEEMAKLVFAACTNPPAPVGPYERYSTSDETTYAIQNFGIPGLRVNQISANSPDLKANPFYERLLPAGDNRNYKTIAGKANPTFFTLWVGMSEVVAFASSGATACRPLPTKEVYLAQVAGLLDTLSKKVKQPDGKFRSTKPGVILNLPTIKQYAFTRLADPIQLQSKIQQDNNNSALTIWIVKQKYQERADQGHDTVQVSYDDIILAKGLKNLNRRDQNLDMRNINGTDVMVPHGLSKLNPLSNDEILDATEIIDVDSRIISYNVQIDRLLGTAKAPSVYSGKVIKADIKGLFDQLQTGINYNGVKINLQPVTGGVYSLDNFSLTPRGQALIANKVIQSINTPVDAEPTATGFGTRITEVNIINYPGNKLP